MEFGLKDIEINALREVLASVPEVEEAIIYGSRAKGTNRISSDIDITLKGKELTYLQLALLDAKIDDLYLPYFVDLSLFSMLRNQDLIASIEREGQLLYTSNNLNNN
jgi:predicted nucleotidyltransferase